MRAVRYHEYGGPEVLRIDEVDVPEPNVGQIQIKVAGAGLNPADYKIMRGLFKAFMPIPLPTILGAEASGTVTKLGPGSEGFSVGDEVFGIVGSSGAAADYAVMPVASTAKVPASLDLEDAAGLSVAALTAWQALFTHGGVRAGQRVLIHAAAGGVGSFAVQLAKWKGATVVATASAINDHYVREIGADEVVDYTKVRFEEVVRDVDMVLDSIGGDTQARSAACLKKGGILVSLTSTPDTEMFESQGKRATQMSMKPNAEQLRQIASLVEDMRLILVVDVELPLARAAEAVAELEKGRARGKMILRVS